MNSIVDHSQNGIIYVDSAGEIQQLNSVASVCLRKKGQATDGRVINLGTKNVYIKSMNIEVGRDKEETIVFLHDTGKIQQLEAQIRKELSDKGLQAHYTFERMIASDPMSKIAIAKAKQYSLTDSTVLLLGETGTGKEFFAQSIHNHSARKDISKWPIEGPYSSTRSTK